MTALPIRDTSPLDHLSNAVLRCFPDARPIHEICFLKNHGGFSGASLWRVRGANGTFCLRAWPSIPSLKEYLPRVHHLMAEALAAGLAFIPGVQRCVDGETIVSRGDRRWDLTTWMPGQADFHEKPKRRRLTHACIALARLHEAWKHSEPAAGSCPAIHRRLHRCQEWTNLLATGWRPALSPELIDPCAGAAAQAWPLLQVWIPRLPQLGKPWADRSLPLQPCHCDLWHDHVLYEGDEVSALLDFGSVKLDHVAVDLARLLGSMAGDDLNLWSAGLEGYRTVRPLSFEEETLAHVLDRTGSIIGLANWLRWLFKDGRVFADQQAVGRRMAGLVARIQSWG